MWSSSNQCEKKCSLSLSTNDKTYTEKTNQSSTDKDLAFAAGLLVGAGYSVEKAEKVEDKKGWKEYNTIPMQPPSFPGLRYVATLNVVDSNPDRYSYNTTFLQPLPPTNITYTYIYQGFSSGATQPTGTACSYGPRCGSNPIPAYDGQLVQVLNYSNERKTVQTYSPINGDYYHLNQVFLYTI